MSPLVFLKLTSVKLEVIGASKQPKALRQVFNILLPLLPQSEPGTRKRTRLNKWQA